MLLRETIHWMVMNVSDMRYWAFLMKNKTTKLVPFSDIKEVFILHPSPLGGEKVEWTLPQMRPFQFAGMTNPVKAAMGEEIYDMVNPQQVPETYPLEKPTEIKIKKRKSRKKKVASKAHVTVTAEQRYANKLNREAVVRTTITIDEEGYTNTTFLVKMHVRGSQYLIVDQNTGKEYWGKWKMSTDEWSFWRDDYQESKASNGNGNASGDHRSSCCYTLNHHRLANRAFCAACEHDTPSNRTARRIQNGGPEQTVIFNGDGSLTQKWNQRQKQRIQDIKKREKKEMEDFE